LFTQPRRFFCSLFLLLPALPALAAPIWTQPAPEELKMTSDPAAPNAEAVYLFREETVDDKLHYHSLYVRIKVLTEKGKEEYGDIEVPYEAGGEDSSGSSVGDIQGRTIHSDGTIIPFTGKPMQKLLTRYGDVKVMAKVFSMPDVQVGSIIEYRYDLRYGDHVVNSPQWYIQQPIYVHKAHYHFIPFDMSGSRFLTGKDSQGHENVANRLLYYQHLPGSAKVTEVIGGGFDLLVDNIPASPDEPDMPPLHSLNYRVLFYYSPYGTGEEFWKQEGKYWSKSVNRFANVSDKMKQAVAQIVTPGDTDDQKLHKIYDAVMKLENSSFTRVHSAAENKAEGLRVKTADDIWAQKRGYDDEITRLFIALARAAGLKAYAMIVTDRNENLFIGGYLFWSQLDDEIAIVNVGGKEMYFDPGQRYCEFGKLHWKHSWTAGIRQTDGGTQIATTPGLSYMDTSTERFAEIEMDPDGKVHGLIRMTFTGATALRWREAALRNDEREVKKNFEEAVQRMMPPGVIVKTNHFVGLTDYAAPLMVQVDVSGSMGTATGKRVFLPATFFEAAAKPWFVQAKRENPIDLNYPYKLLDQFTLTLPPNVTVESAPQNIEIPLPKTADYVEKFQTKDNKYAYGRLLAMGVALFDAKEYPDLRDFFQKTNTQDQQQLVLKLGPMPTASTPAPAAGSAAQAAAGPGKAQ
jgi:hypothetical protein